MILETWILIISFAFHNADDVVESDSFSINMESRVVCEQSIDTFNIAKIENGVDVIGSISAECFNSSLIEKET